MIVHWGVDHKQLEMGERTSGLLNDFTTHWIWGSVVVMSWSVYSFLYVGLRCLMSRRMMGLCFHFLDKLTLVGVSNDLGFC